MTIEHKLTIDEVLTVETLSKMPHSALRLMQLMEDPDTHAEEFAEVIRLDTDLTAQVLRLCNSASYGLSRKISTVKEAVAILGLKTLKSMVYVILSKMALDRPVKGYGLEKGDLWYNGLSCAVYAKFLAETLGGVDAELAFTCGLLRDIGKIALGQYVGTRYKSIEELAVHSRIAFDEAETMVLGVNHCEVGKALAEKWNMPEDIVAVIEFKNQPSDFCDSPLGRINKPGTYKLITIVHLADAFTRMIGSGIGSDGLMYTLDGKALEKFDIQVNVQFMDTTLAKLIELDETVAEISASLRGEGN